MNQTVTHGIVLSRLNFGEADKIITLLTPDNGKIRLMARGVRKVKSKLAGGIELFSISNVVFIKGKKDIGTLVSTRLLTHFNVIVESLDRTMVGYDVLKMIHRATEDDAEGEYYELAVRSLTSLNDKIVDPILIKCWFMVHLLTIMGHSPNLRKSSGGSALSPDKRYKFDYTEMGFFEQTRGEFTANHIKLLRLMLETDPRKLQIIKGLYEVLPALEQMLQQCLSKYLKN